MNFTSDDPTIHTDLSYLRWEETQAFKTTFVMRDGSE
jgi:hypothetical protein